MSGFLSYILYNIKASVSEPNKRSDKTGDEGALAPESLFTLIYGLCCIWYTP